MRLSTIIISCCLLAAVFVTNTEGAAAGSGAMEGEALDTMLRAKASLDKALQGSDADAAGRVKRAFRISGQAAAASDDKCVVVRPDGTVFVVPCDRLTFELSSA